MTAVRIWVPNKVVPGRSRERVCLAPQMAQGVLIPRGTIWDGASVPAVFRPLIGDPFDGPFALASLLHDLLYGTRKATREIADLLFWQELIANGAGTARADIMYRAVRMFAWGAYGSKIEFATEEQMTAWGCGLPKGAA